VGDTFDRIVVAPCVITVDYEELDGSPTEHLDQDLKFTATRQLKCAWHDRILLMRDLKGYWSVNDVTGDLIYHLPHRYPRAPGLKVQDVQMKPVAAQVDDDDRTEPVTIAEYYHCFLTAKYARDDDEDEDDESDDDVSPRKLFRERLEPRMDYMQLEARPLGWAGTSGVEPIDPISVPPFPMPACTWVIERYWIPGLVEDIFRAPPNGVMGAVNVATIKSPTLRYWTPAAGGGIERGHVVFPAGTLLFEPPLLQREIVTRHIGLWSATFRFHYKPNGWNKFPKVEGTAVEWRSYRLLPDGDAIKPYPEASFNNVLKLMFVYTGVPYDPDED